MGYQDLVSRTVREHALLSVLLELTYRCNLDCTFCYNDLSLSGRGLGLDDYERLLADMEAMQVVNVTLSGGEPLASPVFWPVGRRARELGFVVRVKSNGHALRLPVARRLRDEVDPFCVESSLHGATAATHDRQTRVAGSFERLVENLAAMRAVGLRVKLNCTLTRWNEDELEAMFELADGADVQLSIDPVVTPRDDGDRSPLEISASPDAVARLYALVTARVLARRDAGAPANEPEIGRHNDLPSPQAGPGRKNCGAGAATLAVDPFGNVYPCVQWRRPVGNLHQRSIAEIWGGHGLAAIRDDNARAGAMIDALGPEARRVGFCPGLADQIEGDPATLYPAVRRNLAAMGVTVPPADAAPRRAVLPILAG